MPPIVPTTDKWVKTFILNEDGTYTLRVSGAGSGSSTEAKQDDIITELKVVNSLVPSKYDFISLSYTGSNLTGVIFKTGGVDGDIVSTLALTYDDSDNLTSVTKT